MAPDYDLSNLVDEQVDLWIYLQGDTIFRRLTADQAERRGFPSPLANGVAWAVKDKPSAIFSNGLRRAGASAAASDNKKEVLRLWV